MRCVGITMIDLAAVILVGGQSSRMGTNKAMLPLGGKRLVDVVAEKVRAAGVSRLYVSGMLEGYTSIPDFVSAQGPMGGITTCALRLSANHKRLLFLPVDMPYLSVELVQTLMHTHETAACHFSGHPLPCILSLNSQTLLPIHAASKTLASGQDLSVKTFLDGVGASAIPVPAHLEKALTNTNTPAEWQEVIHESSYQ